MSIYKHFHSTSQALDFTFGRITLGANGRRPEFLTFDVQSDYQRTSTLRSYAQEERENGAPASVNAEWQTHKRALVKLDRAEVRRLAIEMLVWAGSPEDQFEGPLEIEPAEFDRNTEVDEYAHSRNLTREEAIRELVNKGLSHAVLVPEGDQD